MNKIILDNFRWQRLIYTGLVTLCIVTFSSFESMPDRPDSLDRTLLTCNNILAGKHPTRTELFFGAQKRDGMEVSNAEFQRFLDREVTPRFPDGFTLLAGNGQFRNASGVILKERSYLLILLYPVGAIGSQKIEQIRKAYIIAFQQPSVLRTDDSACASF